MVDGKIFCQHTKQLVCTDLGINEYENRYDKTLFLYLLY